MQPETPAALLKDRYQFSQKKELAMEIVLIQIPIAHTGKLCASKPLQLSDRDVQGLIKMPATNADLYKQILIRPK